MEALSESRGGGEEGRKEGAHRKPLAATRDLVGLEGFHQPGRVCAEAARATRGRDERRLQIQIFSAIN